MKQTAGRWDPKRWPIYFVAGTPLTYVESFDVLDHMLMAVNEMRGPNWRAILERGIAQRKDMLIDSGVYWLATEHAKRHHVTMDSALQMSPDEIDGFKGLFDQYVDVVRTYGNDVWGYIEIDQGGRENKMRTRARLEAMGLRPIPVYHPFNDGWDYFDYLGQNYDRICFGNVVNAGRSTRKRLCATAWERRRRYPNLWIHLLGMTPSDILTAFPINSCDSSTWVGSARWDQQHSFVGASAVELDGGFSYILGDKHGPAGWSRVIKLCGYNATMLSRSMSNMARSAERELGADVGLFSRY